MQLVVTALRSNNRFHWGREYVGQSIKVLNIQSKEFKEMVVSEIPKDAALIQVGSFLYSFGGSSFLNFSSMALVLSLKNLERFRILPNLPLEKTSQSVCYYHCCIYSFCGIVRDVESNKCEMYSILHKQWKYIPRAINAREKSCSCVIKGIAYLIGGRNKTSALFINEKLNLKDPNSSWEQMHVRTNSIVWSSIDSKAIAINGDLILVGSRGQCYAISISKVETMNAKALHWDGKVYKSYDFKGFVNNSYRVINYRVNKAIVHLGSLVEVSIY